MSDVASRYPVSAWKTYPHPTASRLDSEDIGMPFIERATQLGINVIASHRGISGGGGYARPGSPVDVVRAAKAAPDPIVGTQAPRGPAASTLLRPWSLNVAVSGGLDAHRRCNRRHGAALRLVGNWRDEQPKVPERARGRLSISVSNAVEWRVQPDAADA
jgi:hypothetical protein